VNRQFSTRKAAYIAVALFLAVPAAYAQRGNRAAGGAAAAASDDKPEEGIPVTNELVVSKCGTCHTKDAKGNLSRISWERSTPEGWEEAIKRMVRLNGLVISPADARTVVKYLATYHGLAPSEAKPVMYMAEHRTQDETIIPNDVVRGACTTCHAFGRPMSWRRSKDDWKLLENLHVALYAQADVHFRRPPRGMGGGAGGAGGGGGAVAGGGAATAATGVTGDAVTTPPGPEPGEAALDFLSKSATLHTPEWAEWRARLRAPRLAGRWLVSATVPGYGKYVGEMMIEPGPADDEFKTSVTLKSVKTGNVVKRSGTALVYAGYSWRGRSKGVVPAKAAPDDLQQEAREALWISPDQTWAEGRWFWGEYQEFGVDVKLIRVTPSPRYSDSGPLLAQDRFAWRSVFAVIGSNLPAQVTAADLGFRCSGLTVKSIVSHSKSKLSRQ
jgi:quinohemoprotein amine dehydrogenase